MNPAIRLEREKRKTIREEQLWQLLSSPAFVDQLALVAGVGGTYALGKSRLINRDMAGLLCGLSAVVAAARAGVHDKWALGVIWTATAAMYALAVPPTDEEALVSIDMDTSSISKFMLGSDEQLFFLPKNVSKAMLGPFLPASIIQEYAL